MSTEFFARLRRRTKLVFSNQIPRQDMIGAGTPRSLPLISLL